MRVWWKLAIAAIALALGGVVACNSPTIPIPPLGTPTYQMGAPDSWTATGGGASPGAEVFVVNRTTGDGVATRADANGHYATPPFGGQTGDGMELFYRKTTGEYAPSICTPLTVGAPPVNLCP